MEIRMPATISFFSLGQRVVPLADLSVGAPGLSTFFVDTPHTG